MNQWLIYFDGVVPSIGSNPWYGDPFHPPQRVDVQVIARVKADGDIGQTYGKHYYIWRDCMWIGVDQGGMDDYLMTYLKPQSVLYGRTMVRSTEFWELVARVRREGVG